MNIFKKIYCRLFQGAFRLALPVLPYREPRIFGSVEKIEAAVGESGMSAVLIITTEGAARRGFLSSAEEVLCRYGVKYSIYDKTKPNPTVENVEEALSLYNGMGCDGIIAIGGGSVIDCAKAVGARVAYPNRALNRLSGVLRVRRKIPTLVAVPTTAGTGSEVTLAAVITDEARGHKYAIMSFPLIPSYAVLDPALTYSLPPHLTASTGMDALTHAVEAYIGRSTTKKTRKMALDATSLIFKSIERAYTDGTDREARQNMLRASYMAGVAFSMSYVGYVHAIAHSLGGKYDTPHGLANAVILPHVLRGYGKCVNKRLHELGVAAGVCQASDSHEVGAEGFISAIVELQARLGIPTSVMELRPQDIPSLARHAEREANPLYPVPRLMTDIELREFYYKIMPKE